MGLVTLSPKDDDTEQKPLVSRVDSLEGATIGVYENGKSAAEPLLTAVQEKLADRYPEATFEWYHVPHLNQIKNDDVQEDVRDWADGVDVGIGAIGDCGSCTKFLAWGVELIEDAGIQASDSSTRASNLITSPTPSNAAAHSGTRKRPSGVKRPTSSVSARKSLTTSSTGSRMNSLNH